MEGGTSGPWRTGRGVEVASRPLRTSLQVAFCSNQPQDVHPISDALNLWPGAQKTDPGAESQPPSEHELTLLGGRSLWRGPPGLFTSVAPLRRATISKKMGILFKLTER